MAGQASHWGTWIESRSHFVGFKRQSDFANAVGCGRTQLAKWFQLKNPPAQMRKGFDHALAKALRIDRQTLFQGWNRFSPTDVMDIPTPTNEDVPWGWEDPTEEIKRRDIRVMCDSLHGDDLNEVLRFTAERWKKIASEMDERLRASIQHHNEKKLLTPIAEGRRKT